MYPIGPINKQDVRKFQRDNHIQVDGVVGDQTWRTLMDRIRPVVFSWPSAFVGFLVGGLLALMF